MSTKPGTWSGMLQLAAVASVFCRPVRAVYPKTFGLATQKYMDTVYKPRITDCHEANPVTIMWSSTRSEWKNLRPHPNHFVPCVCVSNICICSPDIVISSYALVGDQDEVGWETQGRKKHKPLPKSQTKSQSKKISTRNLSLFELLPQKPLTSKIDQSLLGPLGASTSDLSSVLAHQLPSQGEANSPVISGEKVPVAKNRTVTIATATKWKTENDKKLDTSMWLQFQVDGSSVSALKCSVCAKFEDKLRRCKNFTQALIIGSRNMRSSAFKGHADSDMHKQAMQLLRQNK